MAASAYYGGTRILCRALGLFRMFVDVRDLQIAPHLCLDGYWEPWLSLAISRAVTRGGVYVDVGAAYGYYSLLMALGSWPSGRVIACEPNPSFAEYLRLNVQLNSASVEIHELACASSAEQQAALSTPLPFGSATILDAADPRIDVDTTTLDLLCRRETRIDLIKVDAEGAELLVWRGGREVRMNHPHCVWVIELHTGRIPNSRCLLYEISQEGYPLRVLTADGDLAEMQVEQILDLINPHLWISRR